MRFLALWCRRLVGVAADASNCPIFDYVIMLPLCQMRCLPVAVVKREFSRLLEAAEHGQRTVILRHGRPVAALGPVHAERPDLLPLPRRPVGLLTLLGALVDWETLDADIAEVLAARHAASDRPPPDFD